MTHPDSEVLAEFRAGLITGRSGARISAHLATCERCTGLSNELAEISALLAAVPAPVMPDAVAQRLESVLAAEAVQRDYSERAVDDGAPDRAARPPRRHAHPPPRRHWDFRLVALRVLAPAAAVVVLAAGGYGLTRIGASSTSSQAASSGVASAASSAQAGAGADAVPSASAPSRSREAPAKIEAPAKLGVVTSGTNYQPATLAALLERELRLHNGATVSMPEVTPPSLRACVLRVTSGVHPGTLFWVEKARYQGQPAIVIVARSGHDDVAWVTTSTCSGSSDHVLDRTTLQGTSAP